MNETIYDYNELKLKLLKFSKYKIIDGENKDIKPLNIKKKLQSYKDEPNQNKKYLKMFLLSNDKIIAQYDERVDKFNLNIFDNYLNEKSNLKIIVYFFDTTASSIKRKYKEFSMTCENIKLKTSTKKYISHFIKYIVPLNGFLGVFFTFFTIYALSEYGIPIAKVMDFPVIAILLLFSIIFLVVIFSISIILIFFAYIPFLIFTFFDYNNIFVLAIFQIISMLAIYLYLKKYKLHLLNRISLFIVKFFISITLLCSVSLILIFITTMSQSISSSLLPSNMFYDKSGYSMVIGEYSNRFSGYPKILDKDGKKYYVPVIDSNYYYVYNIENSKNLYKKDLINEEKKSTLKSICKNENTMNKFQKNYIVSNPYIKPRFLTEKISIDDNAIKLEPLDKLNDIISLEEINDLCESTL